MKSTKSALLFVLFVAATMPAPAQTQVFVPGIASGYFGTPADLNIPLVPAITLNGPATWTPVFTYENFNSVEGLTLNGAADTAVDKFGISYLRLTRAEGFTASSVWYSEPVDVAQGFATYFSFGVHPVNSSYLPADGFAFVIQGSGPSALGGAGQGIGYSGVPNSLAIEFDTYYNPWDPNNNHVAIQSCGTLPNTYDHSVCNLGLQPDLPFVIADNHGHRGIVGYMPGVGGGAGTLRIEVDKQPILTIKVNLQTLLGLTGNEAWVGFTGGTGGSWEMGAIAKWSYSTLAAKAK